MDSLTWQYLFTFGLSLDIYKCGIYHVGYDQNTGGQVLGYIMEDGKINTTKYPETP